MTRLRLRIAERLVEAQRTAALLTTFNEVNMQPVMEMRQQHRERFEKEYGVRLGFMSFFVKASVEALKRYPEVNASVDGHDVVYHGFYDIGIAISSPRGLVVPILRDADRLTMAEIEVRIKDYGQKAQDGKLAIDDITGGTFSISNGGVFGSLLSTPILNPPQSAILGMHKIQERPMAEKGQVVVRPMMYLALTYDHRLVDGREAVGFLVAIKRRWKTRRACCSACDGEPWPSRRLLKNSTSSSSARDRPATCARSAAPSLASRPPASTTGARRPANRCSAAPA